MHRRISNSASSNGQSQIAKGSRVKVAVRCRPAFQDEIEFANGNFFSIVDVKRDAITNHGSQLYPLALTTMSGKQRDFHFDHCFGDDATQDLVYDKLARPVVSEVLRGFNGTIFAYGQTGTGKTYTMGILEFVHNEHAGLIPRAISQIFEYVQEHVDGLGDDITVSISFLQLYRETIQDLLAPAAVGSPEENLGIREDPARGFYVEGLQEFAVRNYREAEALINLGLENRAIAPTLMNSTSSRSHTVLTINIEQRLTGDGTKSYSKTMRSKLLMVDLAGSERVRRTVSKGTRLSEAKSINTSLSALGNVIAALAEQNTTHIPFRDSKLTRLLQDSLGGTAATALIATIGPAAVNYGETLSTLLFAQRCMAVKITPVAHEEVDYAEMCAKLQAQINAMEGKMTEKLLEQQEQYEKTISTLNNELEQERILFQQQEFLSATNNNQGLNHHQPDSNFTDELATVLLQLERLHSDEDVGVEDSWLKKPSGFLPNGQQVALPNGQLVAVLGYCFELIKYLTTELDGMLQKNKDREEQTVKDLATTLDMKSDNEKQREWEIKHMALSDPRHVRSVQLIDEDGQEVKFGSHLAPMSSLEAMTRVEGQFRSNNTPIGSWDRTSIQPLPSLESLTNTTKKSKAVKVVRNSDGTTSTDLNEHGDIPILDAIYNYQSIQEVVAAVTTMHQYSHQIITSLNTLIARKDMHYNNVKKELSDQMVERRKREEEVVNWSFILKYLLASSTKLRKELQEEKKHRPQYATVNPTNKTGNTGPSSLAAMIRDPALLRKHKEDLDNDTRSMVSEAPPPPPPLTVGRLQSRPLPEAPATTSMSRLFNPVENATPFAAHAPLGIQPHTAQQAKHQIPTPALDSPFSTNRSKMSVDYASVEDYEEGHEDYDDASEYSLTSTTRSFHSAATPNSIPMPRYRKSTRDRTNESQQGNINNTPADNQPRVVNRAEIKDLQKTHPKFATPVATQQPHPAMSSSSSNASAGIAATNKKKAPSAFAQDIARNLGLQGEQAIAAMSVIDRVSSISPAQLAALDEDTRQQILQIRRDLGIDHLFDSNGGLNVVSSADHRKKQAEDLHIQRNRPLSAQRGRPNNADNGTNRSRSTTPTSRASTSNTRGGRQAGRSPSSSPTRREMSRDNSQSSFASGSQASSNNRWTNYSQGSSAAPGRFQQPTHGRQQRSQHPDDDDDNFSQLDFM